MDNIELRRRAKLLQYKLAGLFLGVSQVFLSELETGKRPVTPDIEQEIKKVIARKVNR